MPRGEGEVVFLPKKRKPPDIDDSQVITKTAVAAATKTAAATALTEIAVAAAAAAAAATAINRMAVAAAAVAAAAAAAVTKIAVAAASKVAAVAAVNSIAVAAAAAASTLGIRKVSIVRPAVHLRLPTRCATATSGHHRAAVAAAAAAKAAAATAAAATPTSTAMSAHKPKPDIGSISTLGIRKDSRLPTRCDTSGHHRGEHQQTCLSKPQLLQLSISSMQEHCNDTRVSCPGREHLLPGQLAISSAQPNVSMQPPGTPDRSAQTAADAAAAAAAECDESPRVHRAVPLVAAATATASGTRTSTAKQSRQHSAIANSPPRAGQARPQPGARPPRFDSTRSTTLATRKIPPKVEPTVMRLNGRD